MEVILQSNLFIMAVVFGLGILVDKFLLDKTSRKVYKAWVNAVVLTLQEMGLKGGYGEVLLRILTKLHDADVNTKTSEEAIADKLTELSKEESLQKLKQEIQKEALGKSQESSVTE